MRGNYIDAKQLSVTDGNGKRTLDIDSFGRVRLDVTELKINSASVSTKTETSQLIKDEIDKLNAKLESEIGDVQDAVGSLGDLLNGSFADGIIDEAETIAIAEHLRRLDTEKADIDAQYEELYNNPSFDLKAELKDVKDTYDQKHNALKTIINTIISDNKFDKDAESTQLNQAFTDYNNALSNFKKASQKAIDAIAEAKKDLAINESNAYTDAQIKVTNDNINLSVSTLETTLESHTTQINNKADLSIVNDKINAIDIGARNLLEGTKNLSFGVNSKYIINETYKGFKVLKAETPISGQLDVYQIGGLALEPDSKYTLSFYAKGTGSFLSYLYPNANTSGIHSNGSSTSAPDGMMKTTLTSEWRRYWITWTTPRDISGTKNVLIARLMSDACTLYLCGAKFEKGTKATDWSPAPEDTEALIDTKANITDVYQKSEVYTKAQTDSQINIAKDAINLGVSTTYETKANVESKATVTLNSAKSYADTKKQEAINTASSDATNKVNSAKNELNTAINKKANTVDVYQKSETYTKSETDSKIKVAKDAIDLSVSTLQTTVSNHTTQINNKADLSVVDQKIDGIQVGGVNLARGTKAVSYTHLTLPTIA